VRIVCMTRILHDLLFLRLAFLQIASASKSLWRLLTGVCSSVYKNTVGSSALYHEYAQDISPGQILRLVRIAHRQQEDCAAGWPRKTSRHAGTLSRDLQELRLIKTQEGYKPATALPEESAPLPPLARALGEFLLDIAPRKKKIFSF